MGGAAESGGPGHGDHQEREGGQESARGRAEEHEGGSKSYSDLFRPGPANRSHGKSSRRVMSSYFLQCFRF